MRLEKFITTKGTAVYINPDQVSQVESEGYVTMIRTNSIYATVKGSIEDVVTKLQAEESRFPH